MIISDRASRRGFVALLVLLGGCLAALLFWQRGRPNAESISLPADLSQWQAYEGTWSVQNGEITDRSGGRGDKLMAGHSNLNDFALRTDLRFDSDRDYEFGDAGVVLRASNLTVGTDSLYGYYVGLRPGGQVLKFGRMQDDYIDLAVRKLNRPIRVGAWYHLEVEVHACTFLIKISDADHAVIGSLHEEDRDCVLRAGQVGLRSYGMIASWRGLSLQPLP